MPPAVKEPHNTKTQPFEFVKKEEQPKRPKKVKKKKKSNATSKNLWYTVYNDVPFGNTTHQSEVKPADSRSRS